MTDHTEYPFLFFPINYLNNCEASRSWNDFRSVFFFFTGAVNMSGLLRLQELYQRIKPGSNNILIEMVRRVENSREAIQFLQTLESIDRYGRKFVVLDCSASLASEIIIQHVKDVHLGRRNYHYLLSGLVRRLISFFLNAWISLV